MSLTAQQDLRSFVLNMPDTLLVTPRRPKSETPWQLPQVCIVSVFCELIKRLHSYPSLIAGWY